MVRRVTTATTLAAEKADKTKRSWQEQVPTEYHRFGKIFNTEASQRLPGPRPWDHAIDLVENAPEMLNCKTVTGVDTDSMPDSYSRPLANQGTLTAVLWLIKGLLQPPLG